MKPTNGVDLRAARMTEAQLEDHIRGIVADLGKMGRPVLAYHPWQQHAQRAAAGYPDWTYAGPGGHMWRELKTMTGRPSAQQQHWLDVLRAGGGDAKIWRPTDLISGAITRELAIVAGIGRDALIVADQLLDHLHAEGDT